MMHIEISRCCKQELVTQGIFKNKRQDRSKERSRTLKIKHEMSVDFQCSYKWSVIDRPIQFRLFT